MNTESQQFLEYLKEGYLDTKKEMLDNNLTCTNVRAWINHLPKAIYKRDDEDDWDDTVYNYAEIFLKELYQYSIQHKYIFQSTSFLDFIENRNSIWKTVGDAAQSQEGDHGIVL